MGKKLSKVEIKGFEALFYDELIQFASVFSYDRFINHVICDMNIEENDSILDLGCGTAKNMLIMRKYTEGLIVGLDTSTTMLKVSKKKIKNDNNMKVFYHDVRKPMPFLNTFNIAFVSFVLHGFIDIERDKIIKNAYYTLKKGGRFYILDYNGFDLTKKNPFIKLFFKYAECPLASEFLNIDLERKLADFGFRNFHGFTYYNSILRLSIAEK